MPWALFYPADYSIGSASLGYHYVFQKLRELGTAAERFFASPVPYRSVDADTLLERFPVISASIAYECDVPLFFRWLNGAGVPLSPKIREAGGFPIVGMGGAITYINPLVASGVCDFIVLGDGMDVLKDITEVIRRFGGSSREKLWEALAAIPAVFVPPVHMRKGLENSKLRIARELSLDGPYPMHSLWMTPRGAFGKTLLIELQRGCARSCSYCTLTGCFGKTRIRKFETIARAFDSITLRFDIPQAGLVTPEAGDYPFIERLLSKLKKNGTGVSFASLRLDRLTEAMLTALSESGRRSVTAAPETGSDALRFACGKKFGNELVIEKLEMAKKLGIEKAKLYFMVGLPGETDEDVSAITSLCRRIIDETGLALTLSVNPFVPKPGTRWSGENFAGSRTIKEKYEKIKKDMRAITKKAPRLRLTGIKEAEEEFSLAWYGYNDSAALAGAVEDGAAPRPASGRELTAPEIAQFI